MDLFANRRIRIQYHSILKVKRELGGVGKFNVRVGDEVGPADIIAKYQINLGFVSLSLAQMLEVAPQKGKQCLNKNPGDRVYKGETLAEKKGFFGNKVVVAPTDGIIEEYNVESGELKMKYLPKNAVLACGVYGIVEKVHQVSSEIEIKTMATQVYGVFGSGKERSGHLRIIDGKGHLLMKQQVTDDLRGSVVVGGAITYTDALQKALALGVSGIILGGFNMRDFISIAGTIEPTHKIGTDIGTSLVATEGFGPVSISEDLFKLILNYEDKFVFLDGNISRLLLPSQDPSCLTSIRKVVLPEKKLSDHQPELVMEKMEVGKKVRIIWPPFMGAQGEILAIDLSPTTLPSGISTYLVTVQTTTKKIKVPYPNLELV